MEIKFVGKPAELEAGIDILLRDFNVSESPSGMEVLVKNKPGNLEVLIENGRAVIKYEKKVHFFRALGLLLENISEKALNISEEPQFETCGTMFDLSRNAVMRLDTLKLLFKKMALMGLDSAMLYMEDTYEIKDQPYFGYMRGKYSYAELKELDDSAYSFGIELIPCIQTLAHLEEFLKWEKAAELRDTRGILFVGNEKSYELIDNMISSVSAPFRTKRIHIGMDEASELGRGKFLNEVGYKSRFDIMLEHLAKVTDIVKKHGLTPMMWSDMFLRLSSATGEDYYSTDTEIPQQVIEKTPKELQMVYWDYYTKDAEKYKNLIRKHKAFGRTPAFTGGIWIWNGMGTNYGLSLLSSECALVTCKEEGVKDVFVSLWGDDGNENNVFSALLGLQYYAEHAYSRALDLAKLKKRVQFCTGIDYDSYLLLNSLDETPGCSKDNIKSSNPSKFLLWQDVLLGLFDKHVEGLDLVKHYKELGAEIAKARASNGEFAFIFDVPERLCQVLELKSHIGLKIKAAYDAKDKETLKSLAAETLPEILKRVRALKDMHRKQWLRLNKAFGWEPLDIRYGGVLSRMETAIERINDYVEGRIEKIEELEEERLYYSEHNRFIEDHGTGYCNHYYRIASPNVFFHVLPLY